MIIPNIIQNTFLFIAEQLYDKELISREDFNKIKSGENIKLNKNFRLAICIELEDKFFIGCNNKSEEGEDLTIEFLREMIHFYTKEVG